MCRVVGAPRGVKGKALMREAHLPTRTAPGIVLVRGEEAQGRVEGNWRARRFAPLCRRTKWQCTEAHHTNNIQNITYALPMHPLAITLGVLLGGHILKERHRLIRLSAAALILAGTVMIAFAG